MKSTFILLLFFSILLLSSCATIYTGSRGVIHFNSVPQKAKVYINDEFIGNTPITVRLKRSVKKRVVKIQHEGFRDSVFVLKKRFVPISLLGFHNIFIDVLTGAMVKYKENYYSPNLIPITPSITSIPQRSRFYYITNTNDTVFTAPFFDFDMKFFSTHIDKINYHTIDGTKQTIGANYIKKINALYIYDSYIGALLLSVHKKINYRYITYMSIPYFQNQQETRSILMEELLENGKFHLMKSYFDDNTVEKDGRFQSSVDPIYYLYEDGKKLVRINEHNLLNVLVINFKNEKQLIMALKKKCNFKKLEKYLFENREIRKAA